MAEPLLTTAEAAQWLGVSVRTLEDWRLRGGRGPVYRKLGRRLVRYALADLEAFSASDLRLNTGAAAAS